MDFKSHEEQINVSMNETVTSVLFDAEANMTNYIEQETYAKVTEIIQLYTIPIICIFGLVGNTLTCIVFMQKEMRNNSCSLFLAARSLSDNGFLVTLILVWTSQVFKLHISSILGLCQMLIFVTYVCGCISVWLVVLVTAESYVRICKPMMVSSLCRKENARIVVIFLIVFVVCCYNFPFWTLNKDCSASSDHFEIIYVLIYTDTFLTLIIPSVLISCLMIAIVSSLLQHCNRRRRLGRQTGRHSKSPLAKMTKMLLATTAIFFCLSLPSHVVRLRLMVRTIITGYVDITRLDETIQTVVLLVYYLTMAVNVLVYYAFGTRFKMIFNKIFLRYSTEYPKDVVPLSPLVRQDKKLSLPNMLLPDSEFKPLASENIRRTASQ